MKKFMILTSLLALTACGGGSGGHPGERFQVRSSSNYLTATDEAAESNGKITSMKSEILSCNGNCQKIKDRITGTPSHARSSTEQDGSNILTVYDLSDVNFKFAEEGFDGDFKLVVNDDKKIIAIDMDIPTDEINTEKVDGYTSSYNITKKNRKILFNRDGEEKTFSGFMNDDRYKEKNEGQNENNEDEIDGSNWELAKYTYNSKGGDLKLKYSDFGNIAIKIAKNQTNNDDARLVFIGGYDEAKKINEINKDITKEDKFTGYATGNVIAIRNGDGSGKNLNLDGTAQLVFNHTKQETTLSAQFNNWYDIVYTESGDNKSMEFSDTNKTINEDFRLISNTTVLNNKQNQIEYNYENMENGPAEEQVPHINSDIRYFGDNGTPSEAVGLIQIRDCDKGICGTKIEHENDQSVEYRSNEIRANLGFGVKKH